MTKQRPVLETERLLLRPFELSDAAAVQRYAGDFSVTDTTLNIPYPYKDGMAEEWISGHQDKYEAGELINYAVTRKSGNELVGAIGLVVTKKYQRAELGYWIGKTFWNQGICTEAAAALIGYAFEHHGFHKITANHLGRNPASGKVMQKIGMKKEGVLRDHVLKWDRWEDLHIYGILRSDWCLDFCSYSLSP